MTVDSVPSASKYGISVEIAGAPTRILGWNTEMHSDADKYLVWMIPGNPGVVEYYSDFLDRFHTELGVDIIATQHAGHTVPVEKCTTSIAEGLVDASVLSSRRSLKYLYSLEDQIQHKLYILDGWISEKYPDHKLVIVGHSIGAHVGSMVLKRRPGACIVRVINLFPTLEDIHETPRGRESAPFFTAIGREIMGAVAFAGSFLPHSLRTNAVSLFASEMSEISARLFDAYSVRNILFMGGTELVAVRELDLAFYRDNHEKMVFYYSDNDGWAPESHYRRMIKRFPRGKIHLCDKSLPHSFVLDKVGVEVLAHKLAAWIKDIKI